MSGQEKSTLLLRMPIALRWRDLDAFNHVNNATFMTYLEEARIRWFASLDGDWVTDASAPLLASVRMDYRMPIAYPADIAVELRALRVGNSSLTLAHRIVARDAARAEGGDVVHAEGETVLVWINRASGRPTPLPEVIRRAASTA
jgi:acyl-CoA thioester hydrolase